jgi:hypothetical protein
VVTRQQDQRGVYGDKRAGPKRCEVPDSRGQLQSDGVLNVCKSPDNFGQSNGGGSDGRCM